MAFTVKIPQSYATRLINAIEAGPAKNLPRTRLNVQPDGSLLVRSESAESPYEAYTELFNQDLGIPIAAIRGFETLADTVADANRYGTEVATTSEKKAAIDASGIGGPYKIQAPAPKYSPGNVVTPFSATFPYSGGNKEDLTYEEIRDGANPIPVPVPPQYRQLFPNWQSYEPPRSQSIITVFSFLTNAQ